MRRCSRNCCSNHRLHPFNHPFRRPVFRYNDGWVCGWKPTYRRGVSLTTVVHQGRQLSLGRLIGLSETHSARQAVIDLLRFLQSSRLQPPFNTLLLHGPAGTGKTSFVTALALEARHDGKRVHQITSREPRLQPGPSEGQAAPFAAELGEEARHADLLILEDLQHLPLAAVDTLIGLLDERQAEGLVSVFTAAFGPRRLAHRGTRFPARFTSRLAAGLVVALEPWQAPSRKLFLSEMAQRRQLAVTTDVVDWLGEHSAGNARRLESILTHLETLTRMGQRIDLAAVQAHFGDQLKAARPTVDRIAERVGGYFQVKPDDLQSRRRSQSIVLPRQIGMYLARQLTPLSLEQIGAYFGGRDHTTVLHACRKVEQALESDALVCGAVKDLQAQLG